MEAALPQIILSVISLATGIMVYLTTKAKISARPTSRETNPKESYSVLLQASIERIERLEKENKRLRDTKQRLQERLQSCNERLRREQGYRGRTRKRYDDE